MPTFTKTDLGISIGVMIGLIIAKKYVRPVVKGAL